MVSGLQDSAQWQKFDEDVDAVFDPTAKGDVKSFRTMMAIIVSMVVETFGVQDERKAKLMYYFKAEGGKNNSVYVN